MKNSIILCFLIVNALCLNLRQNANETIKEEVDEQKINEHFLAVFVIIGYLLMLIGFKLNYVDRVSLYFEQFVIFLIPNIIYKSKYKFNKFAILIFSLIYYFPYLHTLLVLRTGLLILL